MLRKWTHLKEFARTVNLVVLGSEAGGDEVLEGEEEEGGNIPSLTNGWKSGGRKRGWTRQAHGRHGGWHLSKDGKGESVRSN